MYVDALTFALLQHIRRGRAWSAKSRVLLCACALEPDLHSNNLPNVLKLPPHCVSSSIAYVRFWFLSVAYSTGLFRTPTCIINCLVFTFSLPLSGTRDFADQALLLYWCKGQCVNVHLQEEEPGDEATSHSLMWVYEHVSTCTVSTNNM